MHQNRSGSSKLADVTGTLLTRTFPASILYKSLAKAPTYHQYAERIVDDAIVNDVLLFKVRWFKFKKDEDTWEPKETFDDPTLIESYIRSRISREGGLM